MRIEPAHQHQVLAHDQRDQRGGEPGVVRQRHRHQGGVALLHAQRIADRRRYPAVTAGLDKLGPPGAAARGHRLPARRHRFGERGIRGVRDETHWHTGCYGMLPAYQQCRAAQAQQSFKLRFGQSRGQRLRHRPQFPARHRRLDPFHGVGQHDRHVVADAHAALRVRAGQPVGGGVEFGAGDGVPVAADRGLVRGERGQLRNLGSDRRDRH